MSSGGGPPSFFQRNRRRLLVTAVAAGGIGLAGYYLYSKYRQIADEIHGLLNGTIPPSTGPQDPQGAYTPQKAAPGGPTPSQRTPYSTTSSNGDRAGSTASQQAAGHLDSIQNIAEKATLPSLLPSLKLRIWALTDLDSITAELKAIRGQGEAADPERKYALWRELNVASFTRALTAVWALPLLGVFVKVQLTLLARSLRDHGDSAPVTPAGISERGQGEASSSATKGGGRRELPAEAQQRFIGLADFFCSQGIERLVGAVREAVALSVGPRDVKQQLTPEALEDLLTAVWYDFASRASVQGWASFVLPAEGSEGEARAMEGLGEDERAALEVLLSDCRRALRGRGFDRAVRGAARQLLEGAAARCIDAVYGEGTAMGAALQSPLGRSAFLEQSVLFAKVVPNVAACVRPLLEAPYEAAIPALQVEETRALLADIWFEG